MALGMRICHIVIAAQIALSPNLAIAGLVVEPGGSALDPARIAKSPPPKTTGKGQIACYNGFSKHCIGMSPGWNPPDDSMEYLIPSQPSGDTIASIRAQTAAGNYSDSDARPSVEVGLLMRAHLFGPALDAANRELVK